MTMLKRFIRYYRPHRKLFMMDMLASLMVALSGIAYPIITRVMLNELIPNRRYRMIVTYGVILLGIYVVRMMLNYFIQYYGHMMGVRMQAAMRTEMFRHLENMPYAFYDSHETGKIMTRMTNDLMDISELAHHGPENFLISTLSILVSCGYLVTINLYLTLIIFACVPLLLLSAFVLKKRMRRAFQESRASIAEINAAMESSISGIRVTKAFNNAETESEKFETGNRHYVKARCEAYHAMGQFHSTTAFITDVFNVVVLIAGGLFLYDGAIAFGDYSAFIVSVNLFTGPVMTLITFMEQFQAGVTGFERFVEIMDQPTEQDAPGATDIGEVKGDIDMQDVTYGYADGKPVLNHIHLHVKAGETLALVGPSGSGKTTICHLIPHFYDCEQGKILLDGQDLRSVTRESVRRQIGIVQQDIYLFNASIKDNIRYGKPDATDEEITEAARKAQIHDYIMTLENGYETVIGERGVRLSGGQKQRLSIARVFLKNPPILILDEATSALDNTTEIQIQEALDELAKGRTTIVVAHRLSTIRNADEIAVIADGNIVEKGNHEALMARKGLYSELYRLQFRGEGNHREDTAQPSGSH